MRVMGMVLVSVLLVVTPGCGGGDAATNAGTPATTPATPAALTPEQMELGIGPVKQLTLAVLDEELAEHGHEVFNLKCAACHKMDQRYVGPPLGQVLERRKPEYVMNMMLNPAEMVEKHPTAKELLAQFMTPMPNQNLTQDEARAVLEYLRSAQITSPTSER
jgi:mono/diheme cytochrome c family protein